jgi:hypothetical protein
MFSNKTKTTNELCQKCNRKKSSNVTNSCKKVAAKSRGGKHFLTLSVPGPYGFEKLAYISNDRGPRQHKCYL